MTGKSLVSGSDFPANPLLLIGMEWGYVSGVSGDVMESLGSTQFVNADIIHK